MRNLIERLLNLLETLIRMGHRILYIPKPVNPIFSPEYGLLYNWPATSDARLITSSNDWIIPTNNNYRTLSDYLGGGGNYSTNSVGGKLKETGLTYWVSPNTGATNEVGFNARGAGRRNSNIESDPGGFSGGELAIQYSCLFWTQTSSSVNRFAPTLSRNNDYFVTTNIQRQTAGISIRLLYVGAGMPTEYTGNDGKVYRVIQIGTQYWLADNLAETKFRTGAIIPWYGANSANYFTNAEWAALTTAGCCAYNNTLSNVATGFTFPT